MEIIVAKSAGFCFGVRRAVKLAEEAARTCSDCVTLGPIIHNDDVIKMLEDKGVGQVKDVSQISSENTVIIRSHGIGKTEREALEAVGADILDATCPDVAKIHGIVKKEAASGRTIIVIGEKHHPEVSAITEWCGENCFVAETDKELEKLLDFHPEIKEQKVSVVFQTTGTKNNYKLCVNLLEKQCTSAKIFDTICGATSKRQEEARDLAKSCDAMIVIGGKASANSRRLAEICAEVCPRVFFVENADELNKADFEGVSLLGITAGASTPAWIIKEVNQKMSDENKIVENQDVEETFEEMLEKSIKTLYTGEKVAGTVTAITGSEVTVDLGTKQAGYIPYSELSENPNVTPADVVSIGDTVEAIVMRVNDVEGTVMLSKKRLDAAKAWDDLMDAKNEKTVYEGVVVEDNKGGVVVNVKGIRVFVPASQTDLPKGAPMSDLLKKNVKLRITEVNQGRRRVVGSIRAVTADERRAKVEAIWNEIEEGKRYKGVVKSMTSYGAFVDIGGVDGMIHVSELSWSRIKQPSDVLNIGDEIEVYVISFDKEKRKISLGFKDKNENPWLKFTNAYEVGSVVNVKIVKLMPFGAFAEIIPGVDGLIHISQIADRRIGKPEEELSEGQMVDAKIIDIDNEKKKVSLSIRALLAAAPQDEESDEEVSE